MIIDLNGKKAIVCGSTQGIGKAIALQLAGCGASVILCGRNEENLKAVLAEVEKLNPGAEHGYLPGDFNQPELLHEAAVQLASREDIHILINNTGGPPAGPIATAATDEFLKAYRQHLLCNHLLAQAFLPGMKRAGYGRIINIISTSVKQPIPGLGVSNTTRAAVANWAKTLSLEVAPFGITVNNVLPGATLTQRLENIVRNKSEKSGTSLDAVQQHMLAEIPAGRFASADEIAYAAAFLASPLAAYINGINLPVDGGRTACL